MQEVEGVVDDGVFPLQTSPLIAISALCCIRLKSGSPLSFKAAISPSTISEPVYAAKSCATHG